MPRRTQIFMLSGLAALLAAVLYMEYRPQDTAPAISAATGNFAPLPVENPALRLDLLDRLKKFFDPQECKLQGQAGGFDRNHSHPSRDKTTRRMGHPFFYGWWGKTTATVATSG